jgi:hypothetical protein
MASDRARGEPPRDEDPASPKPRSELPLHKRARAARLLAQILDSGAMTPAALAAGILVSEPMLEEYRSGRLRIPLDRQLCLALIAIEQLPDARRAGHALRAQIRAEIALGTDATEVHQAPRVSRRWD